MGFGEKPRTWKPHVNSLQSGYAAAPATALIGSVINHAAPISRTTDQLTWWLRCCIPTPTTLEATTCVVLTGAPRAAPANITAAEPPWLTSPSYGVIR